MSGAIRAAVQSIVLAALSILSCAPHPQLSEPVATFTLRLSAGLSTAERAEVLAGAAVWSRSGAFTFEVGEPYSGAPMPSAGPSCTHDIFVGKTTSADPILTGPLARSVAYTSEACGLRRVAIVWERVTTDRLAKVAAHELGHAMGLEHVDGGVMHPSEDRVSDFVTSEDLEEVCRVFACEHPTGQ